MSRRISDVARDLNVPVADIVAIVDQLAGIDADGVVDTSRMVPAVDVIRLPDGNLYGDVYLTPAAVEALRQQFGKPDLSTAGGRMEAGFLGALSAYDAQRRTDRARSGEFNRVAVVGQALPRRSCLMSWGEPGSELDCDLPDGHSGPHHVEYEWES